MDIVLATFFVREFIEVSLWGVEFRLCKVSCMIWRLGFREGFEVLCVTEAQVSEISCISVDEVQSCGS